MLRVAVHTLGASRCPESQSTLQHCAAAAQRPVACLRWPAGEASQLALLPSRWPRPFGSKLTRLRTCASRSTCRALCSGHNRPHRRLCAPRLPRERSSARPAASRPALAAYARNKAKAEQAARSCEHQAHQARPPGWQTRKRKQRRHGAWASTRIGAGRIEALTGLLHREAGPRQLLLSIPQKMLQLVHILFAAKTKARRDLRQALLTSVLRRRTCTGRLKRRRLAR